MKKISLVIQPNKESMITRNKSAQKKQLHDQTVKTLNQLMMRPNITIKKTLLLKTYDVNTKEVVPVQFEIKDFANVTKKDDQSRSLLIPESDNKEFHPEKHKRNVQMKKIVLQPKHDFKVVGVTNKRKRGIPHKEVRETPKLPDPADSEVTFEELVLIADDQGMDDDDFMEILTCPSPVWWEDWSGDEEISTYDSKVTDNKPDTNSIENSKQSNGNKNNVEIKDSGFINTHSPQEKSHKTDINFFKKFVEKRSKLETVLGGIKSKKCIPNRPLPNSKVRKDSVGGHSDVSINADEFSNTLELIEIPEQNSSNVTVADNLKVEAENKETKPSPKGNDSKSRFIKVRKSNFKQIEVTPKDKRTNKLEENKIVPANLPPLTKNPFKKAPGKSAFASPKHIESIAPEASNAASNEDYSISDINIKFLDEYDEKKNKKVKKVKVQPKVANSETTDKTLDVNQIASDQKPETKLKVPLGNQFYRNRKPHIANNCVGPQPLTRAVVYKYKNTHKVKVKDKRVLKDKVK